MLWLAGSNPVLRQKEAPTRAKADEVIDEYVARYLPQDDANDLLYQVNASRNYDPSPQLEKINAPVLWINSADDLINPPELGIAERESKRLKNGTFVLLPISDKTHGHGTHTWAAVWQDYLKQLLENYGGDVNLTLAAYNAGSGGWRGVRAFRGLRRRRITCGGLQTCTTAGSIWARPVQRGIPLRFNEMRGAYFTSATPIRFGASV